MVTITSPKSVYVDNTKANTYTLMWKNTYSGQYSFEVLYDIGFPGKSNFPASSIKPYSSNLYTHPSAETPLIASISALVTFGLYAIIANVSSAACDRFGLFLLSTIGYMYS